MPSSRVLTFGDPNQYQMSIRFLDQAEVLPTTKGDFCAELVQMELPRIYMQRGRESLPRIVRGAAKTDRVAIEFPVERDQPGLRHDGMDVSPGEIVVYEGSQVSHRLSLAPSQWGSMSIAPEVLATVGRDLTGRELTPPSGVRVIRLDAACMTHLEFLHHGAAGLAKNAPDKLAHPEVARSLDQALTYSMIRCVTNRRHFEMGASRRRHATIIRRFEEFLAANYDKPLYLAEICRATGASDGTLRACCHEHLGMGPMRYLWLRRMHLARRALFRADPAKTTVTTIATDHGFWELGRFSVEYHTLFEESPSASLRRHQDDRRAPPNRPLDAKFSDFAYSQP